MAKRHWIAGLLVLSLGINLLGAGALMARWAMNAHPSPMAWAMRDMDPATRERMGAVLRGHMQEVAPIRREFRQSQAAMKRVVSSNTLDEAALAQALSNFRDVSQRYQLQLHTIAQEVLPQLTADQRRRAIHRLLQAGTDHWPHQGRKPHRPDGERSRPPPEPEQGAG